MWEIPQYFYMDIYQQVTGEMLFVDYCGPTMDIVNPDKVIDARQHIHVAD